MTFAVSGSNGFIGVHIIHHLLKKGERVRALIRPGASTALFSAVCSVDPLTDQQLNQLEWVACNLYDTNSLIEALDGSDYVIHLTGFISYAKSDQIRLLEVNRDFTANMVDAALATGVKKLIYCSSTAALSKNNSDLVVESKEWDAKLPHSFYGYTKHLGEIEVWRGIEEGLSAVIMNPGVVLGYGDWNSGSNKLFRNAYRNFPFYSEGVTGFVGVKDLARIAYKLCNLDISGEQFLIISENLQYREVANLMSDAMGKRRPSIGVKGSLYQLIYGLISLKEMLGMGGMLTRETVRASISKNHFSNNKVREMLNFQFEPISKVVEDAVEGYKKSPPK